MMNEIHSSTDHEALELLLPWYVNGTLDAAERAMLQQHLQDCGDCRDSIVLLERMQTAVSSESPSPIVPRPNVGALVERLDADARAESDKFGWLTPRALAAAAAIVVLGVALLVVDQDPVQEQPQRFETATSVNAVAASGYVLAVQFQAETSAERQQELITAMGGSSIGPGSQPHTLRVSVSPQVASLEELASFTREVESSPDIVSVVVVAVQLPVE